MDEMERAYFAAAIQDLGEDLEADQTGTKQLKRADLFWHTEHELSKIIKNNSYDFPTRILALDMFMERWEASACNEDDQSEIAMMRGLIGFMKFKYRE